MDLVPPRHNKMEAKLNKAAESKDMAEDQASGPELGFIRGHL